MTICDLTDKSCKPCEGGVTPLSRQEAEATMSQIEGWSLNEPGTEITRCFQFRDFYQTMAFINAMAWVANIEDHHPDFSAGYKTCEVSYTTHAIGGLSENDFICAAKINALL